MKKDIFAVQMSDGITLKTFVYSADENLSVPLPVVLLRTPYLFKDGQFRDDRYEKEAEYYIARGYLFCVQSIRGTHGSEGTFKLLHPIEISDGKDTLSWLAVQPFCNGNVAVVGSSYEGFTALAAGITGHYILKVVFASSAPASLYDDYFLNRGILNLTTLDYLRYIQTGQGWVNTKDFNKIIDEKCKNIADIRTYDEAVFNLNIPEWKLISRNYCDPNAVFWKERQIVDQLKSIIVPTYHMAGLQYDGNSADTVRNFVETQKNSKNKSQHHLLLGFWNHGQSMPHGDGSNASEFIKDKYDSLLRYYLKNDKTANLENQQVCIQSNFDNKFLNDTQYPLSSLKELKLFLNHNGDKGSLEHSICSSRNESLYNFFPLEKNMYDGKQHVEFECAVDRDFCFLGGIEIDVYCKLPVPQGDIMFFFYKIDKQGERHYYGDRSAIKIIADSLNISHINIESSPMMDKLVSGETFGVEITSNNFPVRARNTGREMVSFFNGFSDTQISILHSYEYQSSLTFKIESSL
ncbi:MAG: hypothetical protein A2504_02705 [Bdellovibrionales bacterium RIFOXYD12_FULL_39_22]|nr:MAG: hypothetical protein A2385_12735 [Bdellovibrionales bacterium RIFOXYB1_FULL_39_21]OFZ41215.1 MAG: hypothetical protein A2485_01145 [Bdellovibrionales bacterium RIFOXYC12_FULL_39_17]OFZ44969.1 MAG: hypothetical protein A2404_11890 [Bdellovibrionales bacterium RIFOXYC1_FULL_39_130]OFZ74416.1 MAG: hypothetical protein A2560_12260 [Bdellovibrionales bacterium RIFOXYD1_FULL_39_84]OFZ92418.1 MAG: hypothetical protein A2504_02705 [Bdellovibrionales bacterium RIFOXYD12_FULL_39_22]HLE10747.1 Co